MFGTAMLIVLSIIALIFAAGMLYSREIVHSVIYLAGVFITLGFIYIALSSTFVGAVQIFIYGGAVTVLMMFGVMLTKRVILDKKGIRRTEYEHIVLAALVVSLYIGALFTVTYYPSKIYGVDFYKMSSLLFSNYIPAFIVIGLIIMSSVIGAVYIVKEEVHE